MTETDCTVYNDTKHVDILKTWNKNMTPSYITKTNPTISVLHVLVQTGYVSLCALMANGLSRVYPTSQC